MPPANRQTPHTIDRFDLPSSSMFTKMSIASSVSLKSSIRVLRLLRLDGAARADRILRYTSFSTAESRLQYSGSRNSELVIGKMNGASSSEKAANLTHSFCVPNPIRMVNSLAVATKIADNSEPDTHYRTDCGDMIAPTGA
jgi:hypothetical protein